MNLPKLTNKEFEQASQILLETGRDPNRCPTCESLPDSDGWREYGQYCFDGKIYDCNCDEQISLRRHYTLAGIGRQYMELNWDTYDGPETIKRSIQEYIDNFDNFKRYGMGLEFYSTITGVGKSFAAIHILKELIKKGNKGLVINFNRLVKLLGDPNINKDPELESKMEKVGILVIDDIIPPVSDAQQKFFQTNLEIIIRQRTDWNLPCLITTNMVPEDIEHYYPRIYSLLSAKQLERIEMPGEDNRATKILLENIRRSRKGESKPIT